MSFSEDRHVQERFVSVELDPSAVELDLGLTSQGTGEDALVIVEPKACT